MNAQTLNRMIKASYYAPNGAQLRKACYGLMAVNSRRASVGAMSLEQVAELPKEEQAGVKSQIVQEALVQGSAEDQAKLAGHGLKDVQMYLKHEGASLEDVAKQVQKADPVIVKAIKSEAHDLKGAVQVAGAIAKARTFEEIFSFLDFPINWVQTKYQDFNWFKWSSIIGAIGFMLQIIGEGAVMGMSGGMIALAAIVGVVGYAAIALVIYYLFGDVIKWVNKRLAMLDAWVLLLPFRALSLILKFFGWGLDQFVGGIKDAWKSFFSRQASIAMQSPEFRRAYYSI
jgi:hypothetical protein